MRTEGVCCGDCAKCELLRAGTVDMIPCAIDQIFRRVQRMEKMVENVMKMGSERREISLSSVEPIDGGNDDVL